MSPSAERRRSCGCRGATPAARIRARTEWPPGTESSGGGPLGAGPCELVSFGTLLAGGVGSDVGLDEGLVDAPASPHQRAPDGAPAALGDQPSRRQRPRLPQRACAIGRRDCRVGPAAGPPPACPRLAARRPSPPRATSPIGPGALLDP